MTQNTANRKLGDNVVPLGIEAQVSGVSAEVYNQLRLIVTKLVPKTVASLDSTRAKPAEEQTRLFDNFDVKPADEGMYSLEVIGVAYLARHTFHYRADFKCHLTENRAGNPVWVVDGNIHHQWIGGYHGLIRNKSVRV